MSPGSMNSIRYRLGLVPCSTAPSKRCQEFSASSEKLIRQVGRYTGIRTAHQALEAHREDRTEVDRRT